MINFLLTVIPWALIGYACYQLGVMDGERAEFFRQHPRRDGDSRE